MKMLKLNIYFLNSTIDTYIFFIKKLPIILIIYYTFGRIYILERKQLTIYNSKVILKNPKKVFFLIQLQAIFSYKIISNNIKKNLFGLI